MSDVASKVELLFMINDLKESGDYESSMRLQKIFLESLEQDRHSGSYKVEIKLNRTAKKAIAGAKLSLTRDKEIN